MTRRDESSQGRQKPTLHISVLHAPTQAAQDEARAILAEIDESIKRSFRDMAVERSLGQADRKTREHLRARIPVEANCWLVFSREPLDNRSSKPTVNARHEFLVIPVQPNMPDHWREEIAIRLQSTDINSVQTALERVQRLGIAYALFQGVPWSMSSASLLTSADDRASAAREVAAKYQTTIDALRAARVSLPQSDLDRIHDHYRQQLSEIGGCSDDVIPDDLSELIDDEEIRRFLISAYCVERLVDDGLLDKETFDYALIGSGLWRAFERALNLSVVAAVRRAAGIITTDPFVADGPNAKSKNSVCIGQDKKSKPNYMSLSKPDSSNPEVEEKLQGIMLGNLQCMLAWADQALQMDAPKAVPISVKSVLHSLFSSMAESDQGKGLAEYTLGNEAPRLPSTSALISAIKVVSLTRNRGSHTKSLDMAEFDNLKQTLITEGHLSQALRLIQALRPHGAAASALEVAVSVSGIKALDGE